MFCCLLETCKLCNAAREKQVAPCSCGHSPYIDRFILTVIHLFVVRTFLSEIDLSRASSAKGRNEWSCTPSPPQCTFHGVQWDNFYCIPTWRDECSCLCLRVFSFEIV